MFLGAWGFSNAKTQTQSFLDTISRWVACAQQEFNENNGLSADMAAKFLLETRWQSLDIWCSMIPHLGHYRRFESKKSSTSSGLN